MSLDDMVKLLIARGGFPNEVLVNADGTTLPGAAAVKADHQWDIIYFRSDGWSVAADFYLAHRVRELCSVTEKPWVGSLTRGAAKPVLIRA